MERENDNHKKKGRNSAGYMVYKTPRIIKLKKTNREIKMNKYEQYHWWKKRKQHRRKEKSGRRVHRIKVTEIGTRKAEQRAENWETGRDWNMVGEKKRQSKHLLDVRCSHWRCVFSQLVWAVNVIEHDHAEVRSLVTICCLSFPYFPQCPVDSYLFTWIEKRVRRDASLFACGGETRSDTNYQLSLFSCMHREWTLPSLPYLSPKTLLYMRAQINIHSCTDRLGLCHQAWGSQKERRAGLLNGGRSHWIDNVKTKNGDVKVSE